MDSDPRKQEVLSELLPLLENYNARINVLESQVKILLEAQQSTKVAGRERTTLQIARAKKDTIDPVQFLAMLRTAFREAPDKVGDMAPVPTLCTTLQEHTGWDLQAIHAILYALFLGGKVDLQPGKARKGKSILVDGYSFYWVKPLEEEPQ